MFMLSRGLSSGTLLLFQCLIPLLTFCPVIFSFPDVPEAPVGQPWVSEVSLNSATLSWYGPAYDGGCPVTNYRIEKCDAEEKDWSEVTKHCEVGTRQLFVLNTGTWVMIKKS